MQSSHLLFINFVITLRLDGASSHRRSYIPLESFPIHSQILSRLLVQRVTGVGLQEQELQAGTH